MSLFVIISDTPNRFQGELFLALAMEVGSLNEAKGLLAGSASDRQSGVRSKRPRPRDR